MISRGRDVRAVGEDLCQEKKWSSSYIAYPVLFVPTHHTLAKSLLLPVLHHTHDILFQIMEEIRLMQCKDFVRKAENFPRILRGNYLIKLVCCKIPAIYIHTDTGICMDACLVATEGQSLKQCMDD